MKNGTRDELANGDSIDLAKSPSISADEVIEAATRRQHYEVPQCVLLEGHHYDVASIAHGDNTRVDNLT